MHYITHLSIGSSTHAPSSRLDPKHVVENCAHKVVVKKTTAVQVLYHKREYRNLWNSLGTCQAQLGRENAVASGSDLESDDTANRALPTYNNHRLTSRIPLHSFIILRLYANSISSIVSVPTASFR